MRPRLVAAFACAALVSAGLIGGIVAPAYASSPTCAIDPHNPAPGAAVHGAVVLDASATNAVSVEWFLSGVDIGPAQLTYYGWLYSWNTKTVANASYVLLSEALNSSGSAFSPGVSMSVAN